MTNPTTLTDLAAIASRVGQAKKHSVVSKQEGIQAVKDREVLMAELLRLGGIHSVWTTIPVSAPPANTP